MPSVENRGARFWPLCALAGDCSPLPFAFTTTRPLASGWSGSFASTATMRPSAAMSGSDSPLVPGMTVITPVARARRTRRVDAPATWTATTDAPSGVNAAWLRPALPVTAELPEPLTVAAIRSWVVAPCAAAWV